MSKKNRNMSTPQTAQQINAPQLGLAEPANPASPTIKALVPEFAEEQAKAQSVIIRACSQCKYHVNGNCRRLPPVCYPNGLTMFPATLAEWWCGEFKPR